MHYRSKLFDRNNIWLKIATPIGDEITDFYVLTESRRGFTSENASISHAIIFIKNRTEDLFVICFEILSRFVYRSYLHNAELII